MPKKLSVKEYLKSGGQLCPNCHEAGHIVGKTPDVDIPYAFQSCRCKKCKATWVDQYHLTTYGAMETKEELKQRKKLK